MIAFTPLSKKGFNLLLFVCIANFSSAQTWSGVTKIGIGGQYDIAAIFASHTDKDGNTYVVGSYYQKLILGDKEYNGPNFLDNNFFVAKFDANGNVIWSDDFYGNNTSDKISIEEFFIDKFGDVYVTGTFKTKITFSETIQISIPKPIISSDAVAEKFICKYNFSGTPDWAKFVYGPVAVGDDGTIATEGFIHDGFASFPQWESHRSTRKVDSLRFYNSSPALTVKVKNKWLADDARFSMAFFTMYGKDLWFFGQPYSTNEFIIAKFDPTTMTFTELAKPEIANYVYKFELHNNSLYFLGGFCNYGVVHFDNVTVEAKDLNTLEHHEGYLVKFNLDNGKFEWGKRIDNLDCNFIFDLEISKAENIYITSEVIGIGSPNYVHAFDALGNLLWELTSTAYIHDYINVGVDQYENVYITGNTSNGYFDTAYFGDFNFIYSYTVGFLARIQTQPCKAEEAQLTATICSGEEFVVGNISHSATGIFTDTFKNIKGCDSVIVLDLTVKPAVEAQIELHENELKAIPDLASYKWIDCANYSEVGVSAQVFSPTVSGSYSVTVNLDGCVSDAACFEFVIMTTDKVDSKNEISVTQQPNYFVLTCSQGLKDIEWIRIYDSSGGYVSGLKVDSAEESIYLETNQLTGGFYILQLIGRSYSRVVKVVKSN